MLLLSIHPLRAPGQRMAWQALYPGESAG